MITIYPIGGGIVRQVTPKETLADMQERRKAVEELARKLQRQRRELRKPPQS